MAFLLSGPGCDDPVAPGPAPPPAPQPLQQAGPAIPGSSRYVGVETCAECHGEQTRLWRGSHHDRSMQRASPETVLGDFDDAILEHHGQRFVFRRRGDAFSVETAGADGTIRELEIVHPFGVEPLQQHLVAAEGGRLQALGVAWDTRPASEGGQRWFHLQPDEPVPPGDLLHWTGPAGSWNTMCADCHSTNFRKAYDPVEATYASRWSEIDVACEACHGPGAEHVAWAESGSREEHAGYGLSVSLGAEHEWRFTPGDPIARRVPASTTANATEIDVCAPCHARRSQIAEGDPGEAFLDRYRPALLDEGLYHADGQILDEVYVWGSFLQSRMYAAGVSCSDCHDPHGLQIEQPDAACARCHQSQTFASPAHHHHEPGSAGSSCVGCHMPTRTYMVIDARHDHSFRVPRPDLSVKLGVPNSCTGCHSDRSDAWAAETTASWRGTPDATSDESPHYGEILAAGRARAPGASEALARLAQDSRHPGIVRATAIGLLPRQMSREAVTAILSGLEDPDPLLRMAAVGAAEAFPPEDRWDPLEPRLTDPFRAIRIEAARVLAPSRSRLTDRSSRARLDRALAEYKGAQALNADWPAAHVNLGILYAELGDLEASAREYEQARRLEPSFLPAYINLSDLHRQRGREEEAEKVLREALRRFPGNDPENDPDDTPGVADIHHSLGLLLVRSQRTEEAVESLRRAATQAPANPRYAYVYGVALHSVGQSARALEVLADAHRAHPGSPEILVALATLNRDLGHPEAALAHARELLALTPDSPDAQHLVRALEAAAR